MYLLFQSSFRTVKRPVFVMLAQILFPTHTQIFLEISSSSDYSMMPFLINSALISCFDLLFAKEWLSCQFSGKNSAPCWVSRWPHDVPFLWLWTRFKALPPPQYLLRSPQLYASKTTDFTIPLTRLRCPQEHCRPLRIDQLLLPSTLWERGARTCWRGPKGIGGAEVSMTWESLLHAIFGVRLIGV